MSSTAPQAKAHALTSHAGRYLVPFVGRMTIAVTCAAPSAVQATPRLRCTYPAAEHHRATFFFNRGTFSQMALIWRNDESLTVIAGGPSSAHQLESQTERDGAKHKAQRLQGRIQRSKGTAVGLRRCKMYGCIMKMPPCLTIKALCTWNHMGSMAVNHAGSDSLKLRAMTMPQGMKRPHPMVASQACDCITQQCRDFLSSCSKYA